MKRANKWLLVIVVLGAILRFFRLGVNPPGLYWDEVSLGWNGYSVLKTGMDEHGRFLPIDTFFAFGDYKPPLYIYAAVPSIWLFGLNEFAVRLPSALAGTALILVTYFLVDILRFNLAAARLNLFKLTAAFLVAISPWSVTLSRVGFESNLAVLLNALGVLFFLYSVYKSPRWLPVSVLSFVLAAYTFNANRLLSPIFLLVLTLVYYKNPLHILSTPVIPAKAGIYMYLYRFRVKHGMTVEKRFATSSKKVFNKWRWWLTGAILGAALVLPMVGHLRSPEGKLRWNEVNIFSDLQPILAVNQRRQRAGNNLLARVFHHRYWEYGKSFLSHYFDHFDLGYLFIDGDPNPRINVPGIGQLYLIELPFFLMGLMSLMRPMGLMKTREKLLIFLWFLMAAVPAGMARETPHALRSASSLPVPQIITAMGIIAISEIINKKSYRKLFMISYILFMILSLANFQLVYWRYYPKEWAGVWLTAYRPLAYYIKQEEINFKTIYVTPDLGRPYIYFLFYGDYPPESYIKEAMAGGRTGDAFGFFNVNYFDKYRFYIPDLETIASDELVVTRADPPPPGFSLVKTIVDVNGHSEFNVIRRE